MGNLLCKCVGGQKMQTMYWSATYTHIYLTQSPHASGPARRKLWDERDDWVWFILRPTDFTQSFLLYWLVSLCSKGGNLLTEWEIVEGFCKRWYVIYILKDYQDFGRMKEWLGPEYKGRKRLSKRKNKQTNKNTLVSSTLNFTFDTKYVGFSTIRNSPVLWGHQ